MIEIIWSGGQTGVDQAAWRAAKSLGIPTGGIMPKGFRTESPDGKGYGDRHPEFAGLYGAREYSSHRYEDRTPLNVRQADLTVLIGDYNSPGSRMAYRAFRDKTSQSSPDPGIAMSRPGWIVVCRSPEGRLNLGPCGLADLILTMPHRIVNFAGNRESKCPGIGAWTERYLIEAFRYMIFIHTAQQEPTDSPCA